MKNTLEQIASKIKEAETVLLYPHISMDGDTFGSSAALCAALRKMGKKAHILIEDEIPSFLHFLEKKFTTTDPGILKKPDLSIAIDCSDMERLVLRKDKFSSGKTTICIDHHRTNNYFAELNYVDSEAAATAEIIYDLIRILGVEIDIEIAEAIYTAISTDTGNFLYTNTTKKTHLIAAALYDAGIDLEKISVELYQNTKFEKMKLINTVIGTMEILAGGKANLAYVTQEMLTNTGTLMEETEGIIEMLRNISGVEITAFLKEHQPNVIKVSLRAKTYADVSAISQNFGGGGHRKAAGFTLNTTMEEARAITSAEIIKNIEEEKGKVTGS